MIQELNIKNYALIESLKVQFAPGLNILTGETGAGKSILVDALGLLLGDKAQPSMIRKGADRCQITGLFDLEAGAEAKQFLEEAALGSSDDETLILRRELDAAGKSKAFINETPVTLSTISALGDILIELHSQHEHQRLLKGSEQMDFLDRYAGAWGLRSQVQAGYSEWKSLVEKRSAARISEAERERKIDLYSFQVKEIDEARLKTGEEEEMDRILPMLKNAEKIASALNEGFEQLYESEGSALERLRRVRRVFETLTGMGVGVQGSQALLDEARVKIDEVVAEIEKLRSQVVSDPEKLDAVHARQEELSKLKRKYGTTLGEILNHREKTGKELNALLNHDQSAKEADEGIQSAFAKLLKSGRALSSARKKAGEKLSSEVEKELKDLGFLKASFKVGLLPEKDEAGKDVPSSTGLEKVEFLLSANPGEDLKPIRAVASGGELSRIMLALKKILAQVDSVPTLIFDEVDSGIGGSMGHVIGDKLKSLGKTHQVIAITHLPQVAAFGKTHMAVRKEVEAKRTRTAVEVLEKEARVSEIARMLGGITNEREKPTPASLKHASELIAAAQDK